MKMVKNVHGSETPVSNEEYKLILMLETPDDKIYKDELELRESALANKLVSRGVMRRALDDSRQFYSKY